jgi:riboflavin kinase
MVSTISGEVSEGIREGAWYIDRYASRIKKLVGYTPYSGTLNIRVQPSDVSSLLAERIPLRIESFTFENRTLGGVSIFPAKVDGVDAAILIPDRTRYGPEIIEVIAPLNLRKRFRLEAASPIEVVLE